MIKKNAETAATLQENAADTRTETELLADVMGRSKFLETDPESLPDKDDEVPNPEGDDEAQDSPEDDGVDGSEKDSDDEAEGDDTDEDSTTDEVWSLDEHEDFKVKVKVDGKEKTISMGDLVKNYQTDQHLSEKGRELGDARKALEADRKEKIDKVDQIVASASSILMKAETKIQKAYHDKKAEVDQARKDGDTYNLAVLKDEQDVLKEKYWDAHDEREAMMKDATAQKTAVDEAAIKVQIDTFYKEIKTVIPGWTEDMGTDIRDFVLNRDIPIEYLRNMLNINVIKMVNDLRVLEGKSSSKGKEKRKKAAKPVLPMRKKGGGPKKTDITPDRKKKIMSGAGTKAEDQAYLRDMMSHHFPE